MRLDILHLVFQLLLLVLAIWILPRRIPVKWYGWLIFFATSVCIWSGSLYVTMLVEAASASDADTPHLGWLVGIGATFMEAIFYGARFRNKQTSFREVFFGPSGRVTGKTHAR